MLSKAAKAYHPGRGVYRLSYKNACRLASTETNMAYHKADKERWAQLDFVVGFWVEPSKNHPEPDICDDLKGEYPKTLGFALRFSRSAKRTGSLCSRLIKNVRLLGVAPALPLPRRADYEVGR